MPQPRILVAFDTTALQMDWAMTGLNWDKVWSLQARSVIQVLLPEVVLLEAARQYRAHLDTEEGKLTAAEKRMEREYQSLRRIGRNVERFQVRPPLQPFDRKELHRLLTNRVLTQKGEVLPLPSVSHADVVQRDLDRRKPFEVKGKGYRDALMWYSLLERLASPQTGLQHFILVTNNTNDYSHPQESKRFEPGLEAEIPEHVRETGIQIVNQVEDLFKLSVIREASTPIPLLLSDPSAKYHWGDRRERESVAAALTRLGQDLAGETVSAFPGRSGIDFSRAGLHKETDNDHLFMVAPIPATATWTVYQVYEGGQQHAEGTIEALVTVHALIDVEYYLFGDHEGLTSVEPGDLGDHEVYVTYDRRVTLHFRAVVDPSVSTVTSCDFEFATQAETSEE